MPNKHGQVTSKDFKASENEFRIMREEMSHESGGELSIIANFPINTFGFAQLILIYLREKFPNDVFTLCDDKGPLTY